MRINLLPPPPPRYRRNFVVYWLGIGLLVVWTFHSAVGYYLNKIALASKNALFTNTNASIQQLQSRTGELQAMVSKWSESQQLLQLRMQIPRPIEAINNLYSLLPSDGSYSAINYSSGTISTTATLSSYYEAAAFIVSLYNDNALASVSVTSVSSSGAASGVSSTSRVATSSGNAATVSDIHALYSKLKQSSGGKGISSSLTPSEQFTISALMNLAKQNNTTLLDSSSQGSVTVPFSVIIAPGYTG